MALTLQLPNEEYVDKIERGEVESVDKDLIRKMINNNLFRKIWLESEQKKIISLLHK